MVDGAIEQRRDLFPFGLGLVGLRLHGVGFLFARAAAHFSADEVGGMIGRGAVEPRGQQRMRNQVPGFAGEHGERGLRDVLRQMRINHDPHCGRVNNTDVTLHQRGKGGFGPGRNIVAEQLAVGLCRHVPIVTR